MAFPSFPSLFQTQVIEAPFSSAGRRVLADAAKCAQLGALGFATSSGSLLVGEVAAAAAPAAHLNRDQYAVSPLVRVGRVPANWKAIG